MSPVYPTAIGAECSKPEWAEGVVCGRLSRVDRFVSCVVLISWVPVTVLVCVLNELPAVRVDHEQSHMVANEDGAHHQRPLAAQRGRA